MLHPLDVYKLPHAPATLPAYATSGSAGLDLQAAIDSPVTLLPMERCLMPTGLIFHIPEGYEVQLRARSGLAVKHGITLVNGIGTIDSDYRNEVKVGLINLGAEAYTITPGERICQMVVSPVQQVELIEIQETCLVESRQGGFGSTGKVN